MPNHARWFVEVILKARRTDLPLPKGGSLKTTSAAWEYLIKWAGWDESYNEWGHVRNLSGCGPLLSSFWEEVGEDAFFINFPGFEVEPGENWIKQQKLRFAKETPLEEVLAQNKNPKRKRSRSRSRPRTPVTPAPSTPNPRSPKKGVSFARVASVNVIPSLTDVENTAQHHYTSEKRIHDSDDEDDTPIAEILNLTPTGVKIKIPRRVLSLSPTVDELMAVPPPASPTDCPLSPPPSPYRVPRSIKIYDVPCEAPSKLATKKRLSAATLAPGIPRASPAPSANPGPAAEAVPADDAMDVDPTPTLVPPDEHTNVDADMDENSPMLASFTGDDGDSADTGFYGRGEDPYASLWNKVDPLDLNPECDLDMDDELGVDQATNAGGVDEFLNSLELQAPTKQHDYNYRPSKLYEPAPMKQWAWNGRVTISVSGSNQTICERATLTDGTEAEPPRIGSFVHLTRDLEFASLFDVDDIFMFLPICNPAHQFARLSAEGPDAGALEIVAEYMLKKKQAVMIPAIMDEQLIGCLLFVPPASKSLLAYLKTPSDLCAAHGLVAVLLFVTHPPIEERYKKRDVPRLQHRVERAVLSHELWLQSLREEKAYHVALGIVQLPAQIREFVYKHASTVWAKSSSDDLREDQDTRHLLRVLKRTKVGLVQPTDTSADIAFIHVGALKNIHNFPHLAQRRLRPDFRFCVYGTHETVHPSRWGFLEIYLLGGVVTFTPQALVHDTWDVLRTIRNIHAHPLWLCYLIPEVVGMAIKLNQLCGDEMQEYTGMLPHMMDRLFGAILEGQVALLQTPVNDPTDDDVRKWVLAHALFRPLTTQAILEYCTKAFEDAYAETDQERWAVVVKNDILTDMRRAQVQPALLTDYRRFILLDANSSRYSSVDGIECDTVAGFKFNDDFVKDGAHTI